MFNLSVALSVSVGKVEKLILDPDPDQSQIQVIGLGLYLPKIA